MRRVRISFLTRLFSRTFSVLINIKFTTLAMRARGRGGGFFFDQNFIALTHVGETSE